MGYDKDKDKILKEETVTGVFNIYKVSLVSYNDGDEKISIAKQIPLKEGQEPIFISTKVGRILKEDARIIASIILKFTE